MTVEIVRHQGLADRVVIVDGLAGCGKTMLSPVIASYERVEKLCFAYEVEYICALNFLGRMDKDAAKLFVRLFADQLLYELMMSRNVNFRPSDLSSVFRDPQPLRYFSRLFRKGDREVPAQIQKERPILHLTTHHMLTFAEPIFEALGEKLIFIELVRHPLYMIKQHVVNMETICGDGRDLNVYIKHDGQTMPYYALEWRDKFVKGSPPDRAIYYFEWFFDQTSQRRKQFAQRYPGRLVTVPFEQLVLQPEQWLGKIEDALGVQRGAKTQKELKRQNIPRRMVAEGLSLPIYKRFGWEPPKSNSEQDELSRRRDFIRERASSEAFRAMDRISRQYEEEFPFFRKNSG